MFDIVFMVQHYLLYTNREDPVAKHNEHSAGGSEDDVAADGAHSQSHYEQLHSPINVNDKAASEDEEKVRGSASNGHFNDM